MCLNDARAADMSVMELARENLLLQEIQEMFIAHARDWFPVSAILIFNPLISHFFDDIQIQQITWLELPATKFCSTEHA